MNSSARSDVSVKSNKNAPLSAKLKTSPYAIPISARSGSSSTRNIGSASSARGSGALKVTEEGESTSVSPEVLPPRTPPLTDENITHGLDNGPCMRSDELESRDATLEPEVLKPRTPDAEASIDELLEQEGLAQIEHPDVDRSNSENHVNEGGAVHLADMIGVSSSEVPDSMPHGIDQLEEEDRIKEAPVALVELQTSLTILDSHEEQNIADHMVQSAISSIYCGNSTFIASIPEEMDVVASEEQRNVGAPSPPEPSPTPADDSLPFEKEDLQKSLTEAFVEAVSSPIRAEEVQVEAHSPSPVNGNMELSQYSMVTMDAHNVAILETQIREELGESDGNEIQQNTRKRRNVWKRLICCGK